MRSSCTADNLMRSPSVAGRIDALDNDDAHTDYAESDVMLGGNNSNGSHGTNSNGERNMRF